ncbi:MAG: hypothetical protein KBA30_02315, partial [Clostridia bacterium]|nr:hypothetical protein [Clostridia bacterium]
WDIAAFLGWAKTVPGTGLDGTPTPGTGVPAGTGSGTAATTETDAVLLSAEGLLEHLPAGMDSSLGWATWNGNGFSFSVPAFLNAATMVEQLAVSGLTADRMATGALPSASGSPAFSGRYLIKIGDSSRLSAERSRLGPALGLARIPFAGTERIGAHVYSLCVRADAAASPGVADFAAFVALDPDARLLASRFYQSEGYLPVLRDQEVWEATAGKADAVRFFLAYRPLLENAYVDGSTCIPGWEAVYTDRFRRVESELLKGTLTAGQAVEALQADS